MAQPDFPAAAPAGASTSAPPQSPLSSQAPGWGWWLIVAALLLPFAYACGFLFPRGDDFDEVTRAMFPFDLPGGLYEVAREWLTWSGRFSYHFLAVFLGRAGELRPLYGLVCAGVMSLYALGAFGLAREAGVTRRAALFCGLTGLLVVLCLHQSLPNLYLLTDALTMGLLQAMTLVFLWVLCRLWNAPTGDNHAALRTAIIVGVLTVGVFEHAALAALAACTAACLLALLRLPEARAHGDNAVAAARDRLRRLCLLWAWVLGAVLVSFLAPGNQVRRATRHISTDVQWRQLAAAFGEWQRGAFWFFENWWPLAALLFVLLLRVLCRRQNTAPQAASPIANRGTPRHGLWLAALAIAAYLGLSALLTVLHACSDVTLTVTSKLPAGLAVLAAYACGFALWGLLDAFPAVERGLTRLPQKTFFAVLLLVLLAVCVCSGNWRLTAANAANGSMLRLGAQLQKRYDALRAMGEAAQTPNAAPRFGLLGEIYRPGARKRAIDPHLPMAAVQQSLSATVFPVQMGEALPRQPETWPNLWVAWMFGLGGVYSAGPSPAQAVAALETASPTPLAMPEALRAAGIEAAWLTRTRAVPEGISPSPADATFDDCWLILRSDDPARLKRIAVLRLNKPDGRRLLPLFVQKELAARVAAQAALPRAEAASGLAAWAGELLPFVGEDWKDGAYLALPLGSGDNAPSALFLGLDTGPLLRLDPALR